MQVLREATKSRKALQLVMITTYGVRQNVHSGIMQSQVKMDDLFASEEIWIGFFLFSQSLFK